jgi:hypothetical protein
VNDGDTPPNKTIKRSAAAAIAAKASGRKGPVAGKTKAGGPKSPAQKKRALPSYGNLAGM